MDEKTLLREPVILAIACAAVAVLAARGTFLSMFNFPWIFGLVCLVVGLLSLRRQPRVARGRRLAVILVGPLLALGGFLLQVRGLERRIAASQAEISAALVGTEAPRLTGLEALNVEPAVLERAASYTQPATLVTFWAYWCSPCWKELPELDELYRRRAADGLAVVALTHYDEPGDEAAMASQLARDRDWVRERDFAFPAAIYVDTGLHDELMVRAWPSGALIDDRGKIVAYGVGIQGGRELMRRAVELLDRGSASPG